MELKLRLTIMNFFQFFVWGAWLITIGVYWFGTKGWEGTDFGLVFMTLGISSVFTPTLAGIIADRWLNAEKLYGILHILSGLAVFSLTFVETPNLATSLWVRSQSTAGIALVDYAWLFSVATQLIIGLSLIKKGCSYSNRTIKFYFHLLKFG